MYMYIVCIFIYLYAAISSDGEVSQMTQVECKASSDPKRPATLKGSTYIHINIQLPIYLFVYLFMCLNIYIFRRR